MKFLRDHEDIKARITILDNYINKLSDTQKTLAIEVQFQNTTNHTVDANKKQLAIQLITTRLQIEVLSVIKDYIKTLSSNRFVSNAEVLEILNNLNIQADTKNVDWTSVRDTILDNYDQNKHTKELHYLTIGIFLVAIALVAVTSVLFNSSPNNSNFAIFLGISIGLTLMAAIFMPVTVKQYEDTFKDTVTYLDKDAENKEYQIENRQCRIIGETQSFREIRPARNTIYLQTQPDGKMYCHFYSKVQQQDHEPWKTIELSNIKLTDDEITSGKVSESMGNIMSQINNRKFTNLTTNVFNYDSTRRESNPLIIANRAALKDLMFNNPTNTNYESKDTINIFTPHNS